MILSLIVAYAKDEEGRRVIGNENSIPWNSPRDMARFKEYTMGNPIIMGRKTHESIGRILPGRKNIIITHQEDYKVPGAVVVNSLDEALSHCQDAHEAFIIGGETIYLQVLDRVERLYLTEIEMVVSGDTFFPAFKATYFKAIHSEKFQGEKFTILERANRSGSCKSETPQEVDNPLDTMYYSDGSPTNMAGWMF